MINKITGLSIITTSQTRINSSKMGNNYSINNMESLETNIISKKGLAGSNTIKVQTEIFKINSLTESRTKILIIKIIWIK